MLWLLLALTFIAIFALLRAPRWIATGLFALSFLLSAGLMVLSGPERALAPILLHAFALGFFVPAGARATRTARVAPPQRRRVREEEDTSSPFDISDIPGYDVLEKVGSGGMASVYKARRKRDGKTVALKIPMEQYVADAKFIRRFHREAEVAQRLDHINIVRTFEHGSVGAKHFMAMEFVDGRSLESYIEREELSVDASVQVMRRVVDALQHIHMAGIIHRDIKPANIMILKGGVNEGDEWDDPYVAPDAVKLMDFGIAGGKILSRLTMTGARIGTPIYMSPEQARGLKIDHRSDIYSLGLVFYEMLTGETAFKGGYEVIVHQQIFQMPPPPRQLNLSIPQAVDALIMRMVAKDPDERPELEEIAALLEGKLDVFTTQEGATSSERLILAVSAREGVLRVLDIHGNLCTSFGEVSASEGAFSAAPQSVAVDADGNVYVAIFEYRVGQASCPMIHKLSPSGERLLSFGHYGMKPGELLYPTSVAVGSDPIVGETVYVLDAETCQVGCFSTNGQYQRSFGGRGEGHGSFNDPRTVLADERGVYVLDYGNRQIQHFDAAGNYQTRWAFKMEAGNEGAGGMRTLSGLAPDRDGNLYIAERSSGKVRKVTPDGAIATSFAVQPLQGDSDALLDLAVDEAGYLYAAQRGEQHIYKYDAEGNLEHTAEAYAPITQMILARG